MGSTLQRRIVLWGGGEGTITKIGKLCQIGFREKNFTKKILKKTKKFKKFKRVTKKRQVAGVRKVLMQEENYKVVTFIRIVLETTKLT